MYRFTGDPKSNLLVKETVNLLGAVNVTPSGIDFSAVTGNNESVQLFRVGGSSIGQYSNQSHGDIYQEMKKFTRYRQTPPEDLGKFSS